MVCFDCVRFLKVVSNITVPSNCDHFKRRKWPNTWGLRWYPATQKQQKWGGRSGRSRFPMPYIRMVKGIAYDYDASSVDGMMIALIILFTDIKADWEWFHLMDINVVHMVIGGLVPRKWRYAIRKHDNDDREWQWKMNHVLSWNDKSSVSYYGNNNKNKHRWGQ